MNTHLLTLLSLAAFTCGHAFAQEAATPPPKPPLPKGPLPAPPAQMAQWMIIFDAPAPAASPSPGSAPAQPNPADAASKQDAAKPPPRNTHVTKTGNIFRIVETDPAGRKTNFWDVNGMVVSAAPDKTLSIVPNASSTAKSFTEFSWIGEKNYLSAGKYAGVDSFVFKDKILPPGTDSESATVDDRVEAIAVIDSTTLMPLYLQIGEAKKTYRFGTPPGAMLQPPQEVMDLIGQRAKRVRELTRRPQ